MPLETIVFFDLETSGLLSWKHEIIQFAAAAVETDNGQVIDKLEFKLEFDIDRAEEAALKVNNYDPELWQDAKTQTEARKEILHFFGKYKDVELQSARTGRMYSVTQLAGYNSEKFDMAFLKALFGPDVFVPVRQQSIDVLQMVLSRAPLVCPPQSLRLADVYVSLFGKDKAAAVPWHDAMGDVQATIDIWKVLR